MRGYRYALRVSGTVTTKGFVQMFLCVMYTFLIHFIHFVHSFIHTLLYVNLNIGSVKLHTLVYDILPWRKVPDSNNAGSVRVGVHLCGPHVSVSGTHVSVSGTEEIRGQCRKCEGWCAPL